MDIRQKAIELAATLFANWKAYESEHDYAESARYRDKYMGAECMAKLMGITSDEIEQYAWKTYGSEIGRIYEENNATW